MYRPGQANRISAIMSIREGMSEVFVSGYIILVLWSLWYSVNCSGALIMNCSGALIILFSTI